MKKYIINELKKYSIKDLLLFVDNPDINVEELMNTVADNILKTATMNSNDTYKYLVYLVLLKARLMKTWILSYPLDLYIPNKEKIEMEVINDVKDTLLEGITVKMINEQILREINKVK
jgi:hypothetical protein